MDRWLRHDIPEDVVESQRIDEEVHNGTEAEIEDKLEETGKPLVQIELMAQK